MKKMSESYKNTLIAILLIGIISMTIVYANFTHYLNVRAQTGVKSSSWNVHFENLVNRTPQNDSNTAVINKVATLSTIKTEIYGLGVTLNKPGDKVVYTFDIVNDGQYDARLDDYVVGTPHCSKNSSLCNNIIFDFKYTNGNKISQNDILKQGESINVTMTIAIDYFVTSMPYENVYIDNLTGVFYYVQN